MTKGEHNAHTGARGGAIALDLLDPGAVRKAVLETEPEAIIHEATALADLSDFEHFDRSFHQTNRLRIDGTDALLAAQSNANHRYAREGGPVKSEEDPLDPSWREGFRAVDASAALAERRRPDRCHDGRHAHAEQRLSVQQFGGRHLRAGRVTLALAN